MNKVDAPYKHNELTFQVMVDASPNALILVNEEGNIIYTNNFFEKLFKYKKSELIGQKVEKLISTTFEEENPGFLKSFFVSPKICSINIQASKKDKTMFPAEIKLKPIIIEHNTFVLVSINDTSKLRKAEDFFRRVIESTPSSLILIDKNMIITLVNAQTEKLFGYHRNELLGKSIDILLLDNLECYLKEFQNRLVQNSISKVEKIKRVIYAIDKNKSPIPVEMTMNIVETLEGKMNLVSIDDITEREKAEKEARKLVLKNKELEQFTYITSHDLQEPLKSITSLIEVFTEDYSDQLNEEAMVTFRFLNESAEQMKQLIQSLLHYGRLGQKSKIEPIDVTKLLRSVCNNLNDQIENSNAQIYFEKLPVIMANKDMLGLLFQCLIDNSIKFRKPDIDPIIKISVEKDEKYWVFIVEDNGIGIDTKNKEKIFTIFRRLHHKDQYPGVGIGLSYCKKIVELHEGNIWVESKPDQGAIFYFTINTHQITL